MKAPAVTAGLGVGRATRVVLAFAVALAFASTSVFAQHSPAPSGPAESGLKTNRGGTVPPTGSDGIRFSPNPPPPMPGTEETPPPGKVKTEERVGTPVATTPSATTPSAGATPNPKMTPTPAATKAAGSTTPKAGATTTKRPTARPKPPTTPTPRPS